MKKIVGLLIFLASFQIMAQSNAELIRHYKAYYEQMRSQQDVQGVINAITHLNILEPSKERTDTLAVLYMNQGMHLQALNTIGIDLNPSDSNMAIETKAICLQALNQPTRAIAQFEELFKRGPNSMVAYELADLKLQLDDFAGAMSHIEYGLADEDTEFVRTFYETQTPSQVPVKAAFLYLKSLVKYKEDRTANVDEAVSFLDQALELAPNFNMAQISKDAMLAQKENPNKDN